MSGVNIEIVGVGAYVKSETDKRARPYRRGRVLSVDEAVAERLIARGVAVREGEKPDPVEEAPVEDTVAVEEITGDYESHLKDDLQGEADRRGLEVEGTGADGNVVKDDLVAALEADDAA